MPGHYGKMMKKKNGSKKVTGKRKKLDMDGDAMLRNKKKKKV
jgi:hypothetical protein